MLGYSLSLTMVKVKPQLLQKEVRPDDKNSPNWFLPPEQALREATPEDISHFPDSGGKTSLKEESYLPGHETRKSLGKCPDAALGVLVK